MSDLPISQLANRAGVSPRTIRYYISEGLLPAPRSRGRYAVYGTGYVERLRLIAKLKEAYLPLKEIRERVSGLTDTQVSVLLAGESEKYLTGVSRSDDDRSESDDSDISTWIRYRLEDGIELNVQTQLPPWRARILRRILAEIQIQLRDW